MTTYLEVTDLAVLARDAGLGPITDPGALVAAAHRPTARVLASDCYPTLDDKAAALLHSLVRTPALATRNETLGWLAVAVFYELNGVSLMRGDEGALLTAAGREDVPRLSTRLAALRPERLRITTP